MNWKQRVIEFNEKKDLESMLMLGRSIEYSLPRIKFNNDYQFKKDYKDRNDYIYRQVLKEYKK